MTNTNTSKAAGWKYMLLALGAFTGLGLELAVLGLGYLIFGEAPGFQGPHWQLILHWVVTCLVWSCAVVLLVRFAKAMVWKYRYVCDIVSCAL